MILGPSLAVCKVVVLTRSTGTSSTSPGGLRIMPWSRSTKTCASSGCRCTRGSKDAWKPIANGNGALYRKKIIPGGRELDENKTCARDMRRYILPSSLNGDTPAVLIPVQPPHPKGNKRHFQFSSRFFLFSAIWKRPPYRTPFVKEIKGFDFR